MAEISESFWRLASASAAKTKASWATFQTGEGGRTKTIISVDNDEALVILWALEDYIEKHRREYNETTEGADHRGLGQATAGPDHVAAGSGGGGRPLTDHTN